LGWEFPLCRPCVFCVPYVPWFPGLRQLDLFFLFTGLLELEAANLLLKCPDLVGLFGNYAAHSREYGQFPRGSGCCRRW